MSLKKIAKKKLFKKFMKLPRFLLEELLKDFNKYRIIEEKNRAISTLLKQIKKESYIIIDEIIEKLIISQKTGKEFLKPSLAENLDIRIYSIYLSIAENFIKRYNEIYYPTQFNYTRLDLMNRQENTELEWGEY